MMMMMGENLSSFQRHESGNDLLLIVDLWLLSFAFACHKSHNLGIRMCHKDIFEMQIEFC